MRKRFSVVDSPAFYSAAALACAAAVAACGAETPAPVAPAAPAPSALADVAPAPSASAVAAVPAKPTFENPGGMWMPEQLVGQAATLKSLGFEIDPAALANPASGLLQSVVSLGGCSASFVSAEGLVATNHHCAVGALQYNSSPKENLLHDGFVAKTREAERSNGPTARVLVTEAIRDVTKEVRDGLDKINDDVARAKKVEERTKALVSECEKGRTGVRCAVAGYFGGAQFRLIEQLEIRDVRLVFAGHESVGSFGGEVDNWHWPRHAGDVALFRAYVGKDGKPADYSTDNVPYKPAHHLAIASKPLKQGDLVLVAGYPGKTNRLRTAGEAEDAVAWMYPRSIKYLEENVAVLEEVSKTSPEVAIKARPWIRNFNNGLGKYRGIMDGLVKGGLAAEKAKLEEGLKAWVAADPARKAAYGDVLDKLNALQVETRKHRDADAALNDVYRAPLLASAANIVRMAEERPKADAARDPKFQERNWARAEQGERQMQKGFDPAIDRAVLKLALQRAARLPAKERPPVLAVVIGPGEPTEAKIDAAIDALYKGTKQADVETRVALFKTAKVDDLKKNKEPIVQLALKLRTLQKAAIAREDALEGAMLLLRPRFAEMVQKASATPIAPDANGTLRITYGTVRGYRPKEDAAEYRPFTVASELAKKHTGKEPFDAPSAVLDGIKAKKFGTYADSDLGELPVDFLSDLDITGGNSGSATLNSRGELVGLAFDGNYEAMASDWIFQPKVTRTIHVDLRYVLWLLDGVYGGDHLVKEMGGAPNVP